MSMPKRVKFAQDSGYTELLNEVKKDTDSGAGNTYNLKLFKSVETATQKLKANPQCGIAIPHEKWPKKLVGKYEIKNLWKLDIFDYWRMIYTITKEEIEIICFVLNVVDHDEYNKIFGYKGKKR